jgi:hypothetical protein
VRSLVHDVAMESLLITLIRRYLYMTGDEAVPEDFDQPELVHRGANTAVVENAGPIHNPDDYNAKVV